MLFDWLSSVGSSEVSCERQFSHSVGIAFQQRRLPPNSSANLSGARLLDLLPCAPMFFSGLVLLSLFWHLLRSVPGLFESLGYLFGILLGSFTLDACFRRDSE
jgi:hypothetical protein